MCRQTFGQQTRAAGVLICLALLVPVAFAGIPEPEITLYGQVRDDSGTLITEGNLTWTFTPDAGGTAVTVTVALSNIESRGVTYSYWVALPLEAPLSGYAVSANTIPLTATAATFHGVAEVAETDITATYDLTVSTADRAAGKRIDIGGAASEDADGDGLPDQWEIDHFGDTMSEDGDGDFDEDGLSNADEFALATDPANPDTDGDGLRDGAEVLVGTDPLDADTDDDGLTDGEEVHRYLTNPLTWDTDGDTMDDRWEVLHGLDPRDGADASADTDGDGFTNLEEYENGTHPLAGPGLIGDVNSDGAVDALDATLIALTALMGQESLNSYLESIEMDTVNAAYGDVNLDEHVDLLDATLINLVLFMGKGPLNEYLANEGMDLVYTGEDMT